MSRKGSTSLTSECNPLSLCHGYGIDKSDLFRFLQEFWAGNPCSLGYTWALDATAAEGDTLLFPMARGELRRVFGGCYSAGRLAPLWLEQSDLLES